MAVLIDDALAKAARLMKRLAAPSRDPLINFLKALFWTFVANPVVWVLAIRVWLDH